MESATKSVHHAKETKVHSQVVSRTARVPQKEQVNVYALTPTMNEYGGVVVGGHCRFGPILIRQFGELFFYHLDSCISDTCALVSYCGEVSLCPQ